MGFEKYKIYWYILNPLMLIELTGNYILKVLCCSFLYGASIYCTKTSGKLTAVAIALSIGN
jgi:hypothetical protein